MWKHVNSYLVTIVPPVAKAARNRKTQNNQNHGAKAVATPVTNWMITAVTNGPRRPYLFMKEKQIEFKIICHNQAIDCAIGSTLTYRLTSQTVCCQPKCRTWISFVINWSIVHVRTPNSTSFEWFRWKRFDRIHIPCNWPSICRWLFDPHNGTPHWVR